MGEVIKQWYWSDDKTGRQFCCSKTGKKNAREIGRRSGARGREKMQYSGLKPMEECWKVRRRERGWGNIEKPCTVG